MGKVSNLNKFRKRKAREDAATQATENRVRFGRTKEQRQRDDAQSERMKHRLDQHRREQAPDEDSSG